MSQNKLLDLLAGKDPQTLSPLHVAPVWAVGSPYVSQVALDEPPIAPSNRVFFPLAVARAGRSTDPDWADWERTTLHFPTPIPKPQLELSKLVALDNYRAPKPPVFVPHSLSSNRPYRKRDREAEQADYVKKKTEWDSGAPARLDQHRRALEQEAALHRKWTDGAAIHVAGVASLHRAFSGLVRAVLDEKVTAYFRPVGGGSLNTLDTAILTRSGVGIGLIREGVYAAGDGKRYYLFVDADQLERAFPLAETPDINLGGATIDQLSPYLRLAISVALERGISEANPETVGSLGAELRAHAEKFGLSVGGGRDDDVSKSFAEDIAKAMRWPSARLGRGNTR